MSLISLRRAGKDFGLRTLFSDLDLTVAAGDRLGLIGPNGAGKSTLLRVLAGKEPLEQGERRCSLRTRVILLDQDPRLEPGRTALQEVFAAGGERTALLQRHADRSRALAAAPENGALLAELSDLQHRMEACDAWGLEQRCREMLDRLGIPDPDRRVGELSGGNHRRVALAAALVAEPDVLLLDEPTNHLDADGVETLQDSLDRFPGALVLVTHDRYLLDRVTRRIVAVEAGRARPYGGGYAAYLERRSEEEAAEAAGAVRLQGLLRRELAWLRRGPKARSTRQKARLQRIAALQEAPPRQGRSTLKLTAGARRLGKQVITVESLRLRRPAQDGTAAERELLRDFSYAFAREDRVGIIGPNGSGKSTLLEVLAGRRPPDGGTVAIGSTVRIARFDQHSEVLQKAIATGAAGAPRRVIDLVREVAERVPLEGKEISASQLLERFLFPAAQQYQPLEKLSGGERRRLHLCRLLMQAPNVLLLDEPTNDLDVMTLGVLEDFLEDFRGCVVVVSHDRWFLDRCVDRLFCFRDGVLERHEGTYSDYLERRRRSQRRDAPGRAAAVPPPRQVQRRLSPRRRSFRESRELEAIERDLPVWEERRRELEKALQEGTVGDHTAMERLTTELAELVERIGAAEERWLTLSELPA